MTAKPFLLDPEETTPASITPAQLLGISLKIGDWYVVVERATLTDNAPLQPYAVGPYANEAEAEAEGNSEASITFCLLTIDAKNEGYCADECYWTQSPPKDSIIITPTPNGA